MKNLDSSGDPEGDPCDDITTSDLSKWTRSHEKDSDEKNNLE